MLSFRAPLRVFCSYAREDEALCQQLYAHLRPLERRGLLALWHDRLITAGTDWAAAIDVHLTAASLILLLISPDFFVSDYCYGIEMHTALKRHEANEALVIPVLLRPVDWEGVPFAHLQPLPKDGKPITLRSNQDQAFADVAAGIRRVIEDLVHFGASSQWFAREHQPAKMIIPSDTTVPVTTVKPSFISDSTDVFRESQLFVPQAMQKKGMVTQVQSNAVFLFNERLSNYEEFYGRVRERKTLVSRTFRGVSTSIVGPRRIGKTWLVDYLRLVAPNELGPRFHIAYVDATLASCATAAGFMTKVLEELGIHTFVPDHSNLDLTMLDQIVQELKAKNQTPILCIDEFEGFGNRQSFDLSFFNGLRALTQYGLGLVVTSKSPLIDIIGDYGKSSGFFNIFEQVKLKPFTRQEAEAFIRAKGSQAHFTQQEQAYVLKYGQSDDQLWFPLRLQLVGKLLLEDKILAAEEDSSYYRPEDPAYWQEFEERLSDKYRVVIR